MPDHPGVEDAMMTIDDFLEGPFAKVFGIHIAGIEVTQAIQYRGAKEHLTDGKDHGADNSLTLVADKPAVVRVYVRATLFDVTGVVGTVTLQRRRWGMWVDHGTLPVIGSGSITASADLPYASERGWLWRSLNFRLPRADMHGSFRLKVHVERSGHLSTSSDDVVEIDATLRQTLRVRGIPVQYWGPDQTGTQVQIAAPALADFQSTAAWTCTTWPVSSTPDISLCGTFTWSQPLTGNMANGSCPTSWQNLLFWLKVARAIDGNRANTLYYAMLPTGIPLGDTGGCGEDGGVASGFVGGQTAMAHELGHSMGFAHSRCGLPADDDKWDRDYPVYEPYDSTGNRMAPIGEYGYDVTTNTVMSPATTQDFMSYCSRWMSIYQHKRLVGHRMLWPEHVPLPRDTFPPLDYDVPRQWPPVPPEPPWREQITVRPGERAGIIVVGGRLRHGNEFEVHHVLWVDAVPDRRGTRIPGLSLELVDREGAVLTEGSVRAVAMRPGCGCGCGGGCSDGGGDAEGPADQVTVDVTLDQPVGDARGTAATLRLLRDGEEVWRRDAPARPPVIEELSVDAGEERLVARWRTTAADDAAVLQRFARWSGDDGETWETLAVALDDDSFDVPIAMVRTGRALVEVMVSDGFHMVTSERVAFEVPRRGPSVAALWPSEGVTLRAGEEVRLWGTATAGDGTIVADEHLRWEIDGEPLGPGGDRFAWPGDWEGDHEATLYAVADGIEESVTVWFEVTGSGRPSRNRHD